MVNFINKILGTLVLILAIVRMKISPTFALNFTLIKEKVNNVNTQKVHPNNNLILSIIEIEDKRYFQHKGIDFYSISRALFKCLTRNRIEGASTITQQMVRSVTNKREIKINRKINEIMLAVLINEIFTKKEIMFVYLETYIFNNNVGIYSFCKNEKYNIEYLTISECAQIAARLKYPTLNKYNYINYLKRVRTIEIKTFYKMDKSINFCN